jgi:hypothetical protein
MKFKLEIAVSDDTSMDYEVWDPSPIVELYLTRRLR